MGAPAVQIDDTNRIETKQISRSIVDEFYELKIEFCGNREKKSMRKDRGEGERG